MASPLPVDDRDRMQVGQLFGRQREHEVPERRQRAGPIGAQLADGGFAVGLRPTVVDVPVLVVQVSSHGSILTGRDRRRSPVGPYAGRR